jgi:hypothetical protein
MTIAFSSSCFERYCGALSIKGIKSPTIYNIAGLSFGFTPGNLFTLT